MPSKGAHLAAFLVVLLISVVGHLFVYRNLRRVLVRDFPRQALDLVQYAKYLFILMDLPFIFVYFRNRIDLELTLASKIILYPFAAWQALMILWVGILIPVSLWRNIVKPAGIRVLKRDLRRRRKSAAFDTDVIRPAIQRAE